METVHISVRISKEADRFYASMPNKSEYIRRVLQEHYEEAQQEIRYALDNPEYLRERFEEVKKRLTPTALKEQLNHELNEGDKKYGEETTYSSSK